jgi:drug/metabolite transporter (DMT)-like permease
MGRRLRRDLLIALFVAITWAATSFAVAGILSVVLNRDPVETPAPVYAGPAAVALAGVVVWLAVGFTARARRPWAGALVGAAGVYLVVVGVALLGSFRAFAEQAGSPFLIVAALLAAVAVVATRVVVDRRPPNAGLSGEGPGS